MMDFDALFDLRFNNRQCCEYVLVNDAPIATTQTFIVKPPEVFWSSERCEKAMEWFRRDS